MLKFLFLLVLLFAAALGFHLLRDATGEAALTIGDTVYSVDLVTAVIGAIALIVALIVIIWLARGIVRAPWRFARRWRRRNRERARAAVSQGLVAIAAGDVRAAERATLEAARRAPGQPLTRLLQAQTAQLKGDREAARSVFQEMTEDSETRIAGLRGLYVEAEREGELEAAHQIATRARQEAPAAPWAARALLRHQTAAADWDGALSTLSGAADARILDKRAARRQRAVILTAKALAKEEGEPDVARQAAQEAHDLASDLVPAAVVAGRLLARQGDIRRATRVLETTWKAFPHPELADAYLHVRTGDAGSDRLKRAEALLRMRPLADEGRHAVARAAIDVRDFARAREVLTPILTGRPTQKALMLMAELEEAETGDRGRAREWMARAVYAPSDPVWTADGLVLDEWAPVSPATGKLDAVEWKAPLPQIAGPRIEIDAADLKPLPAPDDPRDDAETAVKLASSIPTVFIERPARDARNREQKATPIGTKAPDRPTLAGAREQAKRPQPEARVVEPPRPDDPGVSSERDDEEERALPAFLRLG